MGKEKKRDAHIQNNIFVNGSENERLTETHSCEIMKFANGIHGVVVRFHAHKRVHIYTILSSSFPHGYGRGYFSSKIRGREKEREIRATIYMDYRNVK